MVTDTGKCQGWRGVRPFWLLSNMGDQTGRVKFEVGGGGVGWGGGVGRGVPVTNLTC